MLLKLFLSKSPESKGDCIQTTGVRSHPRERLSQPGDFRKYMVVFLNTQQISHSTLEDTPVAPFESGLSLTPRTPPCLLAGFPATCCPSVGDSEASRVTGLPLVAPTQPYSGSQAQTPGPREARGARRRSLPGWGSRT